MDWSTAGAGTIAARTTQCGSTISSYTGTAATINTAIASCTAGQHVKLGAGTFNLSTGILFNAKDSVTLRGAGADQTFLVFTGVDACSGKYASICIVNGDPNYSGNPHNTANWTTGYAKGTTQVTLSSTTNLSVGSLIILDQLNDPLVDPVGPWNCGTDPAAVGICCSSCGTTIGRSLRGQQQVTRVTAINGSVVTIADPLYMVNWRTGQSPGAYWSSATAITGVGVEDLSVDHTNSGDGTIGIVFYNATQSWVKGVRSIQSDRAHVQLFQSAHNTIRDSYFYGTRSAVTQSYGVEAQTTSGDLLENNIGQYITATFIYAGANGIVSAYNYSINDYFSNPNWMQAAYYMHGPGDNFLLMEGNIGSGLILDNIHGTANFITGFRNRWNGWELGKTAQTVALHNYSFSRYTNAIGNILGQGSYHTGYQNDPTTGGTCSLAVYALNWGGNCVADPGGVPNDIRVSETLFRWGNYDTVNNAVRWVSGEVPTTDPYYPNSVPGSQTLPNSFYLSSKPSWFGSITWPAIGPDISSGNVGQCSGGTMSRVQALSAGQCAGGGSLTANVAAGHVYAIPAMVCYLNTMGGAADGSGGPYTFNASTCYGNGLPRSSISGKTTISGKATIQ